MVEFILALLLFNSNTTFVKVKSIDTLAIALALLDSNTTFVKVKSNRYSYRR